MLDKQHLTSANIDRLLQKLEENTQAQWGMMTPQHMVEHLAAIFRLSNGKDTTPILTPEDKLTIYREKGLFSDRPWFQNTKSPAMNPDAPEPLQHNSLDEAKAQLLKELDDFHQYFAANPEVTTPNAVFGYLNYEEWKQFHFKHLRHHFQQFGLIEIEVNQTV